jgi:hypothetical protein
MGGKVKRCKIEVLQRETGASQTKRLEQEVFDLG